VGQLLAHQTLFRMAAAHLEQNHYVGIIDTLVETLVGEYRLVSGESGVPWTSHGPSRVRVRRSMVRGGRRARDSHRGLCLDAQDGGRGRVVSPGGRKGDRKPGK